MANITSVILPILTTAFIVGNTPHIEKHWVKRADTASANKTVIFVRDSNTVNNSNKDISSLNFYYHDSLAFGHQVSIVKKQTKLILNHPTLLIRADNKQTPFLIYPGETIDVKYSGTDSVEFYIRNNSQRTNELNFFRKLVRQTGNIYYAFDKMPYHQKASTLTELQNSESMIFKIKQRRLEFLKHYNKESPLSNEFSKNANAIINSTALVDSVLLYSNNKSLLNEQKTYFKLLLDKLDAFKLIDYTPYQVYYYAANALVSLVITGQPYSHINNQSDFVKRFNFVNNNFTHLTRDFLLSYALSDAYNNNVTVPPAYLTKFYATCEDSGYKKIITSKLNDHTRSVNLKGTDLMLRGDGKTQVSLQSLIVQNKGKLIFLDFWASWCAPCRAEMPYLEILRKKYAGKNISLLNISTDTNKEDWLKAKYEEGLLNEQSFLLLNSDQATFIKEYKVLSIPRYILIDKNGAVVNGNAPYPSSNKLNKLIDSNLVVK